jgi:hypothetical protein
MLRRQAKRIPPVTLESLLAGYTEPDRTRVLLSYLRTVDDSYRRAKSSHNPKDTPLRIQHTRSAGLRSESADVHL